MDTIEKLADAAGKVVKTTARVTTDIVNKGYGKATELALSTRLSKLHRQLGALVYALEKNGETNEPMIRWYVSEIDRVKEKMAAAGKGVVKDEPDIDLNIYKFDDFDDAEDAGDAMFRGDDGDELP